jgi:hypothetical protein
MKARALGGLIRPGTGRFIGFNLLPPSSHIKNRRNSDPLLGREKQPVVKRSAGLNYVVILFYFRRVPEWIN